MTCGRHQNFIEKLLSATISGQRMTIWNRMDETPMCANATVAHYSTVQNSIINTSANRDERP